MPSLVVIVAMDPLCSVWARVGVNPWNAKKPIYAVTCPAQPGWLQPQPMTVMSMPFALSQGALQYRLSGVAIHLEIGFAHFPCFSSAMCLASLPQHHSAVSADTLGEVVVSFRWGGASLGYWPFLCPLGMITPPLSTRGHVTTDGMGRARC